MAKILLHIGLPKTATTTLQLHLFHKLHEEEKVNFLGRYLTPKDVGYYFRINDIIYAIIKQNDEEFEENLQSYKQEVNNYIYENKLNIISEEMLTISYKKEKNSLDVNRNLERVHKIFSQHKIEVLLSIRKQDKIIHSFFVEAYNNMFWQDNSINTLDKYIKNGLQNMQKGNFYMYCYDNIIDQCENLFGSGSCKILVFEDIKGNRKRYITTLSNILKFSVNEIDTYLVSKQTNVKIQTSKGYKTAEGIGMGNIISKTISNFIPDFLKKFDGLKSVYLKILDNLNNIRLNPKEIEFISTSVSREILDKFDNCNKVIDKKYKLDLDKYGYFKNTVLSDVIIESIKKDSGFQKNV